MTVYAMPVKQLMREQTDVPSNLRDLVSNMVYVGILAQMLGIDLSTIKSALSFHFKGKEKPISLNFNTVKAAADWAKANLDKKDPYMVEPMDKTDGMIMADGNTAAALGSIYGGVQFGAWYPDHPGFLSGRIAERLSSHPPQARGRQAHLRRRAGRG